MRDPLCAAAVVVQCGEDFPICSLERSRAGTIEQQTKIGEPLASLVRRFRAAIEITLAFECAELLEDIKNLVCGPVFAVPLVKVVTDSSLSNL